MILSVHTLKKNNTAGSLIYLRKMLNSAETDLEHVLASHILQETILRVRSISRLTGCVDVAQIERRKAINCYMYILFLETVKYTVT